MESVVKVDSKGRLLIPSALRNKMGIRKGSELILLPGREEKCISMMPLADGKTVKCKVLLSNSPEGLLSVMEMLSMMNANVLMSESRNFMGNGTSEWTFILDTSQSREKPEVFKEKLSVIDAVKSVDVFNR